MNKGAHQFDEGQGYVCVCCCCRCLKSKNTAHTQVSVSIFYFCSIQKFLIFTPFFVDSRVELVANDKDVPNKKEKGRKVRKVKE